MYISDESDEVQYECCILHTEGKCETQSHIYAVVSDTMDWSSSGLNVRHWVKRWLLGVVLKTRDLLARWWLRPSAMADFQLHRVPSLQTKLCGRSESILWWPQCSIYTRHLWCFLLETSAKFLCYIIREASRIIHLFMNSYCICA
jgi:hypothetical protein